DSIEGYRFETRFHRGIQIRNPIPSRDPDSKPDSIEGSRFETRFHRRTTV
ncbi:hypothetical protein AVEN_144876-1, partial [Araneus ventricosus]